MHHQGTVRLESERLILRPFTESDVEIAYQNWMSDPQVTHFLTWAAYTSVEDSRTFLMSKIEGYQNPQQYLWAIELRELGQPIGSISAAVESETAEILEIGYCIGQKWWHQGITTEAFRTIIPFLFESVGAQRIQAHHDPENPNSGRVMQAAGLTYEGTLRQFVKGQRGLVDAAMHSILRREYEANRG